MTNSINITSMEAELLILCLNYEDRGSQISDNYSNGDLDDAQQIAGGKHEGAGLVGSLIKKGLVGELDSREGDIVWLTELGVNTIFDYLEAAEGTVA